MKWFLSALFYVGMFVVGMLIAYEWFKKKDPPRQNAIHAFPRVAP